MLQKAPSPSRPRLEAYKLEDQRDPVALRAASQTWAGFCAYFLLVAGQARDYGALFCRFTYHPRLPGLPGTNTAQEKEFQRPHQMPPSRYSNSSPDTSSSNCEVFD